MSEIEKYIESQGQKLVQLNVKVPTGTDKLIQKIFEYRKSNGIDAFKSDTIKAMIMAALHLGNPEELLPSFTMPPEDELLKSLENPETFEFEETNLKTNQNPKTNDKGTTEK